MTMITEACAGARFAAELGLTVAGAEGHDLLCACVNCESSDAMHVHQDTGVVFCFSCKHTQSPLQLAESLLRDRTRAWELLDRCGLGTKGAVSINGHAAASAPAKAKKKNRPPGFKTMVGAISNRRSWLISETPGLTIDSRGMSWEYHQADGSVRYVVARLKTNCSKGKKYVPVSFDGSLWRCCDPPGEKLVLFNLPAVLDTDTVWVAEGEKTAEALIEIGLVATTSAHGAGSAHKTDWSPLADKRVIILPDNDAAGEVYAAEVVAILSALPSPDDGSVQHA
jgi:hypothetical protein